MSRTRTASKKKNSPELKPSTENPAPKNPTSKKNDSEKSPSSKSTGSAFGYDSLAMQTLDLWREQLTHFLNNPDAMNDAKKGAGPATTLLSPQISQMFSPLFSGGMDLWLMMLEQLGKAANMNTPIGNTGAGGNDQSKTRTTQAFQSGAAYRPSPASALSGASTYAVAQLASRIADLEKRFAEFESGGTPAARKPAAKKKTAAAALANVKGAVIKGGSAKTSKRKR